MVSRTRIFFWKSPKRTSTPISSNQTRLNLTMLLSWIYESNSKQGYKQQFYKPMYDWGAGDTVATKWADKEIQLIQCNHQLSRVATATTTTATLFRLNPRTIDIQNQANFLFASNDRPRTAIYARCQRTFQSLAHPSSFVLTEVKLQCANKGGSRT